MTDTFTLTGTVHDRHDRPMQDAQLVIKGRSGVLADPNADRIYGSLTQPTTKRLGTLCDRGCSPHPPTSRGAGGMASNANPAVKSVTADLRITLVTLASQRNHFRQTIGGSNSGAGAITSNGQTQSAVSLSAVDLSTQKDLVVTARLSFAGPSMRLLAADLVRRPLTDPHHTTSPLPGSRSPGRVCQQTARSEPVQSTSTTLAPSLMRLRPFHPVAWRHGVRHRASSVTETDLPGSELTPDP